MTLFGRERRAETYRRLAQEADVRLGPRSTWLVYRIADHAPITKAELARLLGIDVSDLEQRLTEPVAVGYVSVAVPARPADGNGGNWDGASVALTSAGEQAADRLVAAREAGIDRLVTDWKPDRFRSCAACSAGSRPPWWPPTLHRSGTESPPRPPRRDDPFAAGTRHPAAPLSGRTPHANNGSTPGMSDPSVKMVPTET